MGTKRLKRVQSLHVTPAIDTQLKPEHIDFLYISPYNVHILELTED